MASHSTPAASIFFSYAGDDNTGEFGWIENFRKKLQPPLKARLRGEVELKEVHSYLANGAVSGALPDELRERIATSAAMVMFVHDGYLKSDACRTELEIFVDSFGTAGLKGRLFIVAMSKPAIDQLVKLPHWESMVGKLELVWAEFYDAENDKQPMAIELRSDGALSMAPDFKHQLNRLLGELQTSLKTPVQRPLAVAQPGAPAAGMAGRCCIGLVSRELQEEVRRVEQALAASGAVTFERPAADALIDQDFPQFDRADRLLLAFNDAPCGHLDTQRRAWIDAGKDAGRILWLDLRHVQPEKQATAAQRELLRSMVQNPVTPEQLLRPRPAAPDPTQAVIYIESNQRELDHWDVLGARLQPHWQSIATGKAPPPLVFRHRGLPIDQLADFPSLAEADGFILLWGQKDPESLVAQIREVEKRVRAEPNLPPGIVAYLMPPRPSGAGAVPAYGWRVLRFDATRLEDIDVLASESERLRQFLRQVHDRVTRRIRPPTTPDLAPAVAPDVPPADD